VDFYMDKEQRFRDMAGTACERTVTITGTFSWSRLNLNTPHIHV
jgi:hypothetical protein